MPRPFALLLVVTTVAGCAASAPPGAPGPATGSPGPDASTATTAAEEEEATATTAAEEEATAGTTAAETTVAARSTTTTDATASFSDAQSDRGRSVFRALCTECHASSDFSDARFRRRWSRRTAGSLFDVIRTTMPESAPGSLRPDHVVDVVAYILRINGFAPGVGELAPDPAVLDAISLERIRGS